MSNILHVEDNADWRSLVGGILREEGHVYTGVGSVQEAREHVERVDIIISDGNLLSDNDGLGYRFVDEQHELGRKVLVLASHRCNLQIAFVSKSSFSSEDLLKAIAQL